MFEEGMFRAETYGPVVEIMERVGGYRLSLMTPGDIAALRRLLDRVEARDEFQPVLVLGERVAS